MKGLILMLVALTSCIATHLYAADGFVVTEQETVTVQKLPDCPDCVKAGYDSEGRKIVDCNCPCKCPDCICNKKTSCPTGNCPMGTCGPTGCSQGVSRSYYSYGRPQPIRKIVKRIFHRRGLFRGRFRGGCSSCR